jgi:hypothetical protein
MSGMGGWTGVAAAVTIAAMPACASAQQTSVGVTITDQDGAPIPLAEVKLSAGEQRVELLSDDSGRVMLDPTLWNGVDVIHLEVAAVGYVSQSVDLNVRTLADPVIRLAPTESNGDDIVVVARRISRPFSPQTLGFIDIITDPQAQADPILAVNNLPSSTNVTGSSRITFRGSRASINRAYLNDTPVYEFSTGSELDSSTENRSIFGLIVADTVETYPGNPPTYLSGATGGVVRVITPNNRLSGSTISVTDLGLSGGHTIASKSGDSFVAVYGSLTDLTLHKAINPGLNRLFTLVRSATGGSFAHLTTSSGGAVDVFVQAEAADDVFPFSTYGTSNAFRLKPFKARSVVSASLPFSGLVLSMTAAFTHSAISEAFGRSNVDSTNNYGFGSLDISSGSARSRSSIRVGVDGEYVKQLSDTFITFDGNGAPVQSTSRASRNLLRQVTGYVFLTHRFSKSLAVSLGLRDTIASDIRSSFSLQASGTLQSADRRHKLIVSLGRYGGVAVPTRAYYGPMSRSTSEQIEADYSWSFRNNVVGLASYLSKERSDGDPFDPQFLRISSTIDNLTGIARLTRSRGFEAYTKWLPVNGLEMRLSYTMVDQSLRLNGQRLRGANDYPSIIRASLKYATRALSTYSVSLTSRSGEPYTRADGVAFLFGSPSPVYGPINATRLPAYLSVDLSLSRRLRGTGLPGDPLIFLGVNNLTNRSNPSSQILTLPGDPLAFRDLAGRSLIIGLTTSF